MIHQSKSILYFTVKLQLTCLRYQNFYDVKNIIFQASRQTISRLSDYADLADIETKEQLNQLYSQLQQEKSHSKYLEMQHQRYRDASARQFENLLHETEDSYS